MAGCRTTFFLNFTRESHPEKTVSVWFQDESRFGQKNRISSLWSTPGIRPRITQQSGFKSGNIFGSVNSLIGDHIGLVTNTCDSDFMQIHLNDISNHVGAGEHVILIVDGAGWHRSGDLKTPRNISILFLPPYSPELNPIERLWLWIKSHHLSNCTYKDTHDLMEKGQRAWQSLTNDIVRKVCNATTILPPWFVETYAHA